MGLLILGLIFRLVGVAIDLALFLNSRIGSWWVPMLWCDEPDYFRSKVHSRIGGRLRSPVVGTPPPPVHRERVSAYGIGISSSDRRCARRSLPFRSVEMRWEGKAGRYAHQRKCSWRNLTEVPEIAGSVTLWEEQRQKFRCSGR